MAEFSRLGDILSSALSRVAGSDEGRAYQGWARAAGADVVAVTRPRRLARGLLTVECESSTWANELTYLTPVILERLRADDPATPVQSLRFVVGRPHRDPDTDDDEVAAPRGARGGALAAMATDSRARGAGSRGSVAR